MVEHCRKGHIRTAENTTIRRDGSRRCKDCTRAYERQYQARTKAYAAYAGTEYRGNRDALIRESAPYCALCGGYVDKALSGRHPLGPSADHIIPVSHGGTHDLSNLQLTHSSCNSIRQNKTNSFPRKKSTRKW